MTVRGKRGLLEETGAHLLRRERKDCVPQDPLGLKWFRRRDVFDRGGAGDKRLSFLLVRSCATRTVCCARLRGDLPQKMWSEPRLTVPYHRGGPTIPVLGRFGIVAGCVTLHRRNSARWLSKYVSQLFPTDTHLGRVALVPFVLVPPSCISAPNPSCGEVVPSIPLQTPPWNPLTPFPSRRDLGQREAFRPRTRLRS